jgi:hypothetical protein
MTLIEEVDRLIDEQYETERNFCVFIITDNAKAGRGGGKRCRCYERRRVKT